MSFLQKIRGWSDKKKRNFAIVIAFIFTMIIVFLWHVFNASSDTFVSKPNPFGSLSGIFQDISGEFNAASQQFASTTALLKAELASSTATSTKASTSTVGTTSRN